MNQLISRLISGILVIFCLGVFIYLSYAMITDTGGLIALVSLIAYATWSIRSGRWELHEKKRNEHI